MQQRSRHPRFRPHLCPCPLPHIHHPSTPQHTTLLLPLLSVQGLDVGNSTRSFRVILVVAKVTLVGAVRATLVAIAMVKLVTVVDVGLNIAVDMNSEAAEVAVVMAVVMVAMAGMVDIIQVWAGETGGTRTRLRVISFLCPPTQPE